MKEDSPATPETIGRLFKELENAEELLRDFKKEEREATRNRASAENDVRRLKELIAKEMENWGIKT